MTCHAGLKWINRNRVEKAGISISSAINKPYPEVTGYFIPTILNFGQYDSALQFAHWLLSIQNKDGSWSDPSGDFPYTFDTGQVLKGLLAIYPRLPEAEDAIRYGCDWMLMQIQPDGRITTPDKSGWLLPNGEQVNENIHLYALEALQCAGTLLREPRYTQAVDHALAYYLAQPELIRFNTLSHFHAYVLEGLVDLGYPKIAAKGMDEVERRQRNDGSVPAYPDVDWVCSTGIAQYAIIWYKLGKRDLAERALNYLCRIQNSSGGFYGSYGRGAEYFPNEEISWAVKFFLDAYYWHIRTAFDSSASLFPDSVEEDDGRLQAIQKCLGNLSGLNVLDAGCGKGRFARALIKKYPSSKIWGVDISDAMLRYVTPEIKIKQGSLLNLPFNESYFDHVYCVEALEHALYPELAISELSRIVKPGGQVVIVDKNLKFKGTLDTDEWEIWFHQDEIEILLRKHCNSVRSEFIAYDNKSEPDGLFIVWQGTRK